ncbi:MAG: class C sortase [Ruminococcus sp.]|nr:class C sortase [Ruminococcus sp.]
MWKKIVLIIAVVLLLTGIGFLLFPPVSNHVGQIKANGVIEKYEEELDNAAEELVDESDGTVVKTFEEAKKRGLVDSEGYPVKSPDGTVRFTVRTGGSGGGGGSYTPEPGKRIVFKPDLNKLLRDSRKYNKSILNNQGTVDANDYTHAALNMSKYGFGNVYAYISASSIGMSLPVYLGANEEMMGYGAAHLNNTSLPLNEKNTNCVVAGHTGYVGRIFFDNIRNLKKGDSVNVKNFWETIHYKVTDYKKVEPNQTTDTVIQYGKKLLTLVTCTQLDNGKYGRYIVICEAK